MIRRHIYEEKLYLLIDGQGERHTSDTNLKTAIATARALNRNPNQGTGGIIKIFPMMKETKTNIGRCIKIVSDDKRKI